MNWDYSTLKVLVADEALPAMIVDLDRFDDNVKRIGSIAQQGGKTLRLASKSLRVVDLMRRVFEVGGAVYRGIMCFSAREAQFLADQGFDDLLVAYPTVQKADLEAAASGLKQGKSITLMLDSIDHVDRVGTFAKQVGITIPVCIDVDVSFRPFGLHLGVRRSPIRTIADFQRVVAAVRQEDALRLVGVMGYEAQIAGLPDQNRFQRLLNPAKAAIKRLSIPDVLKRRKEISQWLADRKIEIEVFNGGGTGSLSSTVQEPWLTELTAGSGFLQSQLFDYYQTNQNEAAFCFALQVTRVPENGTITCHSGGFIASGETSPDKTPIPILPAGLATFASEGCGEVQTPLAGKHSLRTGDPVFFRPAKAGEIAERFHDYILVREGKKIGRALTYRGMGCTFY